MTGETAGLQDWYRNAMHGRIDELSDLRLRLEKGDGGACDGARDVAEALRGSGGTFGFPELSQVATVVQHSTNEEVLRRVEGLISELHHITRADGLAQKVSADWLLRAAGIEGDRKDVFEGVTDLAGAWDRVQERSGLDASTLAAKVAKRLGIEVADFEHRSRAALRLVPEALVSRGRIVPLVEDSVTITVATAEPTSLPTELELERLTGRRPVFVVAPPDAIEAVLVELFGPASGPAPNAPVPPVRPTVSVEEPLADHEKSVLVVDDEPSARLLARRVLEKRGFEVVEASDGLEALEIMRTRPSVGLVVADLNMPRMDGLEFMWELRDAKEWEHLPVIVVTGEVDEILETQLMEEGADDYIRKPVDPRLFLARVEATIRRNRD